MNHGFRQECPILGRSGVESRKDNEGVTCLDMSGFARFIAFAEKVGAETDMRDTVGSIGLCPPVLEKSDIGGK